MVEEHEVYGNAGAGHQPQDGQADWPNGDILALADGVIE
jgi:hypothetical protein